MLLKSLVSVLLLVRVRRARHFFVFRAALAFRPVSCWELVVGGCVLLLVFVCGFPLSFGDKLFLLLKRDGLCFEIGRRKGTRVPLARELSHFDS